MNVPASVGGDRLLFTALDPETGDARKLLAVRAALETEASGDPD